MYTSLYTYDTSMYTSYTPPCTPHIHLMYTSCTPPYTPRTKSDTALNHASNDTRRRGGQVPANEHPKAKRDQFLLHEIESLDRDKDQVDYDKRRAELVEQQLSMQVNAVIPGSEMEVAEDGDYTLYRVVLFKSARLSFEMDCNSKMSVRVIVRDYAYQDGLKDQEEQEEAKLSREEEHSKQQLKRWLMTTFSEAYRAWIHLKIVRVFVESVLRYGLPPKFCAMLIKPGRHEDKVRKVLNSQYECLQPKGIDNKDSESPHNAGVFYPYVDIEIKYTSDIE
jgi:hypothetical protein